MNKHLILIGFMGTGKTTIGRMLHKKTGYTWIDMDNYFEAQWDLSIPEFFLRYGEEAFRGAESVLLKQLLSAPSISIISTGGGSVLREENRKRMVQHGRTVCLTANIEDIVRRVKNSDRPLLQGQVVKNVQRLFDERPGMYDFAERVIHTSNVSYGNIIKEIIAFWSMK